MNETGLGPWTNAAVIRLLPSNGFVYWNMETNKPRSRMDEEEKKFSQVPPKRSPKKAAGSLNPKERNAYYQAFVEKVKKTKGVDQGH